MSYYLFIYFYFFFSSRRRHTRSYGDWSSDVCSSDLFEAGSSGQSGQQRAQEARRSAKLSAKKTREIACLSRRKPQILTGKTWSTRVSLSRQKSLSKSMKWAPSKCMPCAE